MDLLEKDVQDTLVIHPFKAGTRLRLSKPLDTNPTLRTSLISCSSRFHWIVAVVQSLQDDQSGPGFILVRVEALSRALEQAEEYEQPWISPKDIHVVIKISSFCHGQSVLISHVTFAASDRLILLATSDGKVHVFSLHQLVNRSGTTPLRCLPPCSTASVDLLIPNPAPGGSFAGLVAVVYSDRTIRVLDLYEPGQVIWTGQSVTAAEWSPMGKRLVVGYTNGKLEYLTQDGVSKGVIEPPALVHSSNMQVLHIKWIDQKNHLITYSPQTPTKEDAAPATETYVLHVKRQGSTPEYSFRKSSDPNPPQGIQDLAPNRLVVQLPASDSSVWQHLSLLSLSNSTELGIIGFDQASEPFQLCLSEDDRLELPPSEEDFDTTSPLGLIVTLYNPHTLIMCCYTSDGVLAVWNIRLAKPEDQAEAPSWADLTIVPDALTKDQGINTPPEEPCAAKSDCLTPNTTTASNPTGPSQPLASTAASAFGPMPGSTWSLFGQSPLGASVSGPSQVSFGSTAFGQSAFAQPAAFGKSSFGSQKSSSVSTLNTTSFGQPAFGQATISGTDKPATTTFSSLSGGGTSGFASFATSTSKMTDIEAAATSAASAADRGGFAQFTPASSSGAGLFANPAAEAADIFGGPSTSYASPSLAFPLDRTRTASWGLRGDSAVTPEEVPSALDQSLRSPRFDSTSGAIPNNLPSLSRHRGWHEAEALPQGPAPVLGNIPSSPSSDNLTSPSASPSVAVQVSDADTSSATSPPESDLAGLAVGSSPVPNTSGFASFADSTLTVPDAEAATTSTTSTADRGGFAQFTGASSFSTGLFANSAADIFGTPSTSSASPSCAIPQHRAPTAPWGLRGDNALTPGDSFSSLGQSSQGLRFGSASGAVPNNLPSLSIHRGSSNDQTSAEGHTEVLGTTPSPPSDTATSPLSSSPVAVQSSLAEPSSTTNPLESHLAGLAVGSSLTSETTDTENDPVLTRVSTKTDAEVLPGSSSTSSSNHLALPLASGSSSTTPLSFPFGGRSAGSSLITTDNDFVSYKQNSYSNEEQESVSQGLPFSPFFNTPSRTPQAPGSTAVQSSSVTGSSPANAFPSPSDFAGPAARPLHLPMASCNSSSGPGLSEFGNPLPVKPAHVLQTFPASPSLSTPSPTPVTSRSSAVQFPFGGPSVQNTSTFPLATVATTPPLSPTVDFKGKSSDQARSALISKDTAIAPCQAHNKTPHASPLVTWGKLPPPPQILRSDHDEEASTSDAMDPQPPLALTCSPSNDNPFPKAMPAGPTSFSNPPLISQSPNILRERVRGPPENLLPLDHVEAAKSKDDRKPMFFTHPETISYPMTPLDSSFVPKILANPEVDSLTSLGVLSIDQAILRIVDGSTSGLESLASVGRTCQMYMEQCKRPLQYPSSSTDRQTLAEWQMADLPTLSRHMIKLLGKAHTVRCQLNQRFQVVRALESGASKADLKHDEMKRILRAYSDPGYSQVVGSRQLGPVQLTRQKNMRRSIRDIKLGTTQGSLALESLKARLYNIKSGRRQIQPPFLDTINRSIHNLTHALGHHILEIHQLTSKAKVLNPSVLREDDVQTLVKPLDASSSTFFPRVNQAHTEKVALQALQNEHTAVRFKDAILSRRRRPILTRPREPHEKNALLHTLPPEPLVVRPRDPPPTRRSSSSLAYKSQSSAWFTNT